MCSLGGSFFTKEGKGSDEGLLKKQIYEMLKPYISTRVTKRVTNLLDVLRMECCCENLPVQQDRIICATERCFWTDTSRPARNTAAIVWL